jgi:hypothetical protein
MKLIFAFWFRDKSVHGLGCNAKSKKLLRGMHTATGKIDSESRKNKRSGRRSKYSIILTLFEKMGKRALPF